ncbi:MAG: sigma-54 dependent transcriptional regulator [Myxococcota bacterium]|nr:sigma-54 dependent transcriptional regulator [Myxococcota bacterium]MDW8363011.1 sigma-54 dependent transcriptional regulator [Myxococcales bacterium]
MSVVPGRILIVDDEANARNALAELLSEEGHETQTAPDGQRALRLLETFDPDVVLTDLRMPGMDGLALLTEGRRLCPHAAWVVMTAYGSIDTAVAAIQKGAENYLTKPLDMGAVSALVARALEKARLRREASELREQLHGRYRLDRILGDHPSMQRLVKTILQVAPSRATVLLHGESGTGKELLAAAIHHHSPRRDRPFVRLNCAALAESLLESELFGHEKGAFTGAVGRREGRFKQADGGTLFLDEVSEIPLPTQVKLLRFLQEREFERVGGNETLRVDVRVVAATNRDLAALVREGKFRDDLFYRLNVVQIDVPPLRARRSDIPLLAHEFLRRFARDNGREIQGFTDEAMRAMLAYAWPGNVRELENAIERAVVMSTGRFIDVADLPVLAAASGQPQPPGGWFVPGMTMAEIERTAILQTLEACGGSTKAAAQMLGISRRTIQYRLREWGLRASDLAAGGEGAGRPRDADSEPRDDEATEVEGN